MGLPDKSYDRLHTLWERWELSRDDIYYAVENGLLRACVWLPLRYMELGVVKGNKFVYEAHEHKGGFLGVRHEDFRLITSTGRANLRIFDSINDENHIIRMSYEPPQPPLSVCIHDLVVRKEDRLKFETLYGISQKQVTARQKEYFAKEAFCASADYHHIVLNGEEYHLGDVQANIIHQLHDAASSKNQWVHGKTLLDSANSRATRLRDVFKSKEDWNKIIVSNRRGYYRLNLPPQSVAIALAEKTDQAQVA